MHVLNYVVRGHQRLPEGPEGAYCADYSGNGSFAHGAHASANVATTEWWTIKRGFSSLGQNSASILDLQAVCTWANGPYGISAMCSV